MVSAWAWGTDRQLVTGLRTSTALQVLPSTAPQSTHGGMNILLIGLDSRRDMNGRELSRAVIENDLHAADGTDLGGCNTNTLILLHVPALPVATRPSTWTTPPARRASPPPSPAPSPRRGTSPAPSATATPNRTPPCDTGPARTRTPAPSPPSITPPPPPTPPCPGTASISPSAQTPARRGRHPGHPHRRRTRRTSPQDRRHPLRQLAPPATGRMAKIPEPDRLSTHLRAKPRRAEPGASAERSLPAGVESPETPNRRHRPGFACPVLRREPDSQPGAQDHKEPSQWSPSTSRDFPLEDPPGVEVMIASKRPGTASVQHVDDPGDDQRGDEEGDRGLQQRRRRTRTHRHHHPHSTARRPTPPSRLCNARSI